MWTAIVITTAVAVVVGLALFQPWRLFTRSTLDEAVPMAQTTAQTTRSPATTSAETRATESATATPAPAEPTTLAQGRFVDAEHPTSGTARILELVDGSRYLRLENFSTSDGPDIHVWITDQTAGGDDWGKFDDGRFVALGLVKATDGNQNYAIPADADLSGLVSVVIWCDRFNVAFGSAALQPTPERSG
jgi:hypothetical protein